MSTLPSCRTARRLKRLQALQVALVLAGACALALPRVALACGMTDVSCQGDAITYNLWAGVAKVLWFLNRLLLQGAYLLDIFRREVIDVLDVPFAALTEFADSLVIAVAGLALVLAMLLLMVMPFTGLSSPFNIRQILVLTVAAPVILSSLGVWLGDLDKLRVDLSQYIYSVGAQSNVGGGVISSMAVTGEMGETAYLYPATGQCGRMLLPRYSGGTEADRVLRPDEAAAAFLYADAVAIHCPQYGAGPAQDLPQGFYDQPSPGYAFAGDIRQLSDSDRAIKLAGIQAGVVRLFAGLFICFLVLLFYIAQFVFTLALVALFAGLIFGLLFGFFKKDFVWAGEFCSRTATVIQASWVSSFLLGLLFAALVATAQTGNAGIFAGLALGQIAFTFQLMLSSFQALRGAIDTLAAVAGGLLGGGGSAVGEAVDMTASTLRGTAGAALGGITAGAGVAGAMGAAGLGAARAGATTGMTGAMAMNQTGSSRYAMSAMLGRVEPIARLGEVAAGMGLIPDEVADGLRAGQRSTSKEGFRALNMRARSDGSKYRPAAEQRQVMSQIARARSGIVGAEAIDRVLTQMRGDPNTRVVSETDRKFPALKLGQGDPARSIPRLLQPSPRVRAVDLPEEAAIEQLDDAQVYQRLQAGEQVQFNPDGTVTHWMPGAQKDRQTSPTRNTRPVGSRSSQPSTRVGRIRPRPGSERAVRQGRPQRATSVETAVAATNTEWGSAASARQDPVAPTLAPASSLPPGGDDDLSWMDEGAPVQSSTPAPALASATVPTASSTATPATPDAPASLSRHPRRGYQSRRNGGQGAAAPAEARKRGARRLVRLPRRRRPIDDDSWLD